MLKLVNVCKCMLKPVHVYLTVVKVAIIVDEGESHVLW